MADKQNTVEQFFNLYTQHINQNDFAALVGQFAPTFVVGGPQGANCVRSQDFALALPKRKELFDKLGCGPTELVRVETEALDQRFCSARAAWKMAFTTDGGASKEVEVESTFVVDTGANPMQIVLYLAHQDIMGILKERGIYNN